MMGSAAGPRWARASVQKPQLPTREAGSREQAADTHGHSFAIKAKNVR